MSLEIPHSDSPEVSVVMVLHGAWRWAETALHALVRRTTRPYEVVLVDNASQDGTRDHLADVRGAQVLMNKENRGFGPASNQGAAASRSDRLLFLNSDAIVNADWLGPLLDAVARPDVAAAVPRFLNLDGSLQEAGALLARDGSVFQYGNGDEPERLRYRFGRIVDFGAAACLMVRRDAFEAAGGFDPVYAPAYFEDVDLCLALAELGGAVMYEPRSTVTHVGGASGDRDAAAALFRRNRRTFLARWGNRLGGRPSTFLDAAERDLIAGRDARALGRVLVCDDGTSERDGGAAADVVLRLMELNSRLRVSWRTGALAAGALRAEEWLRRGVEVVDDSLVELLENRRYFYDAVVVGRLADPRLPAAIAATQPQASCLALRSLVEESSLTAALADCGIA